METWLLSPRSNNLTQPPPASGAKSEQQYLCIEQGFVSSSLWAVCPPLSSAFILSCSASLSPSVFPFSHTFVCTQPFYLCKLGDTTFSWTWLALSQLSYGLLFHEHRHYFSSLLLSPLSFSSPPPAHMLFAAAVTKIDVQFNDSSYRGV